MQQSVHMSCSPSMEKPMCWGCARPILDAQHKCTAWLLLHNYCFGGKEKSGAPWNNATPSYCPKLFSMSSLLSHQFFKSLRIEIPITHILAVRHTPSTILKGRLSHTTHAEARNMKMEDDRAHLADFAALLQTNLFGSSHFTTTLNIFWTALQQQLLAIAKVLSVTV